MVSADNPSWWTPPPLFLSRRTDPKNVRPPPPPPPPFLFFFFFFLFHRLSKFRLATAALDGPPPPLFSFSSRAYGPTTVRIPPPLPCLPLLPWPRKVLCPLPSLVTPFLFPCGRSLQEREFFPSPSEKPLPPSLSRETSNRKRPSPSPFFLSSFLVARILRRFAEVFLEALLSLLFQVFSLFFLTRTAVVNRWSSPSLSPPSPLPINV